MYHAPGIIPAKYSGRSTDSCRLQKGMDFNMKNMTLKNIALACQGKLYTDESYSDREIDGVVIDSRQVKKNHLFIAVKGERVDGHSYIEAAFKSGAAAVICEQAPDPVCGPFILVENSLQALKDIAKWYRTRLNIKLVGITGSVGKTSSKEFISSVLAEKYQVLKTEGNFNNEIGLPLTILKIRDFHELAVIEMGISDFGEMHRLSDIARPDICVITNIGQCHLENLGTREGILKAKSEIFDFLDEKGSICVNGDDDMLATIESVKGIKPVRFGLNKSNAFTVNDVYASDIQAKGLFGSSCNIHVTGSIIPVEIPIPGEHMILNALAAAAVGTILSVDKDAIVKGIKAVKPVSGRSNIIRKDKLTVIDDCYNANPVSTKAAIDLLAMADNRKLAIVGDMFELGEHELALHEEVGEYAATAAIDVLICIGKLSSAMYKGAQKRAEGSKQLIYFESREEFLKEYKSIINKDDTILVKASHGMGFDKIVEALLV